MAIGVAAGIASGLLGVGGGIVIVPLLVAFAGLSRHEAHATSLAAIVPIALVGAARFALDGSVDVGIAVFLIAGALVGAPIGARLLARSSEATLKVVFGAVALIVAVRMLFA